MLLTACFSFLFICEASSQHLSSGDQNEAQSFAISVHEMGLPFIAAFSPSDYRAHVQNWNSIQADNGLMYIGNTSGVLEYDGKSWRTILLPNGSPAKSFAKSAGGTIYVGGVRDLGLLQPDAIGRMQFQSLLPELEPEYQDFTDIWFTYAIGDIIYFISDHYIFKWNNERFTVWHSNERFGFSGLVNNNIYIEKDGAGLMLLEEDGLTLIPDGDKFAGQPGSITTFLPYDDAQILAAHYTLGLFLYNGLEFTPFPGEENALREKYIYGGTELPNGDYAFITIGNGCFITNRDGTVKLWLHTENGLSSNTQYGAFVDHNGSLWLTGENGMNRIEISSPVRIFRENSGITEVANRSVFFNNSFYVAGKNGVYFLEDVSSEPEKKEAVFQPLEGIRQQTWDLKPAGNYLLAASFNGLFQIAADHSVSQILNENSSRILPSATEPGRLFVGTNFGNIYSLRFRNNRWEADETPITIEGRILEMAENPDGSMWLSSRYNGVYKIDFPFNPDRRFDEEYTISHYHTEHGLPEMGYNAVFNIHAETYFSTLSGIYRFDEAGQAFYPDTLLMNQLGGYDTGFENAISPAADGGMWLAAKSDFENKVYKAAGGVVNEILPLNRFSDFTIYDILDGQNTAFFTGPDGILAYDTGYTRDDTPRFPVQIREVITEHDSLLYAGTPLQYPAVLPYSDNSLRFSYSLPGYDKPEANQYQYMLEGFDKDWSGWTTETSRDVTNLPEGKYHFRVRGKNVYGQISEAALFSFEILPPWYRTWPAYLFYGLFLVCFIMGIVTWRSRKLEKEKETLQKLVDERTRQVQEQAEQLRELDEAKSRFFANISHEFRTPLTLILGQVQQLETGNIKNNPFSAYEMIKRNGKQVLTLINQLLDLSKLESGSMELSVQKTELISFLRPIAAAYESLAESQKIAFTFEPSCEPLFIYADRDKIEKVIQNVISNAFKFTPEGGRITVSVNKKTAVDEKDVVQISVQDSGPGIASEQLGKIFDRFYQGTHFYANSGEGTGIGLALAKELITLHQGMLSVESKPGHGSCFTISILLGREHFADHKIVNKDLKPADEETTDGENLTIEHINVDGAGHSSISKSSGLPCILIVEDNADMRLYIRQILEPYYQVEEAVDGATGLEKAVEMMPDLIISDVMMPGMDGFELCSHLKQDERTSHIPVILLTAKAGKESKMEGLELRADDYLTKPFDSGELLLLLRNRIEQRTRLRERFSREITLQPKDIAITSADERFLQRAMDIVEENMDDVEFSVEIFVEQMHLGRTQVNKKLKALAGQSPVQFIRTLRLKRAAQRIARNEDTISQIAYSVGFNNLSYFAKCFKEQFGISPSDYTEIRSASHDSGQA